VFKLSKGLLGSSKPVMVVTALVAVLGITGTAYGAKLITGFDIKDGSIGTVDLSKSAQASLHGAKGSRGSTGSAGALGLTGAAGAAGAAGAKGDIGISVTGAQGAASSVAGPAGAAGPQGNQGPFGNTGNTGAASTVAGPQGVIGLTGNIACGKSTVLDLLRERGAQVIDADRVTHVLFSTQEDDLGLYGKPMARNAHIWTHNGQLLLNGPFATAEEIEKALHRVRQGGLFGYRLQYPAMVVGRHEVYWHRPLVAYNDPHTGQHVVLHDGPPGYLTAYDAASPNPAKPIELWPRLMHRELHMTAVQIYDHHHASFPLRAMPSEEICNEK
jgi:hypothetical protein